MMSGFNDTIRWYDNNAKQYADNIINFANQELINRFTLLVKRGGKILDAGCAAGRDSKIFYDKQFDTTGIDISQNLIKIAKHNYPQISFQRANFLHLPFPDLMFDGVWAHCSLVHLETVDDVKQTLHEFYRVLNHNGILYILVKQQMGTQKTSVVTDSLSNHSRFFQWFTKTEISTYISEAGFLPIVLEDNYPDFGANRKDVKWILSLSRKA